MEELLVYAILFYEDIITEEQYQKELDKLFLYLHIHLLFF